MDCKNYSLDSNVKKTERRPREDEVVDESIERMKLNDGDYSLKVD